MARRTRKMLWAPFGVGTQALGASAAVSVDLLSLIRAAVPSINNFTIVRIRGLWGVGPSAVTSSSLFYEAGMIVVTQPAFDAGASPDPENDDASYMWRNSAIWTALFVREFGAGSFVSTPVLMPFDVKAQRRVDQADNTLAFVVKNRQANVSSFQVEGMALLNLR